MRRSEQRFGLLGFVALAMSVLVFATPVAALSAPTVLTSPMIAAPGQQLQVMVSGFTAPAAGTTQCVGLLGPGQNVELGRSPAFRPNLGTFPVSTVGEGHTTVTLPSNLVAGSYRIVVGGCSSNGFIAPLAPVAAATISVVTNTPPRLPGTGGVPIAAWLLLGVLGILSGLALRRQWVGGAS
jgi:hypothetical protein